VLHAEYETMIQDF